MATCMQVLIATAEQEVYRGQAYRVIAPSMEGELGILVGHAPLLAQLRAGEVRIHCADEQAADCHVLHIAIHGGFLEVQPDAVVILADAVRVLEG